MSFVQAHDDMLSAAEVLQISSGPEKAKLSSFVNECQTVSY